MRKKRKIKQPFDFGYRLMDNEYREELHENLEVPGIYVRKANDKVYLEDGRIGEMDTSYVVDPDSKLILERMVVNGEHQSTPVTNEKIKMMSEYAIQQIHDEKLPQFSYVVSNIPKEKHVTSYRRSPSFVLEPYFICIDKKGIEKRLNNLKEIINQQVTISDGIALNIGIIALFAPRDDAQEIIREVVDIYAAIIDRLTQKMELTLYSVLNVMINAHFDDEKEYWRMIDVLNEKTSTESIEKFESLDIFQDENIELKKAYANAYEKIDDLEKANTVANEKIDDLEEEKALDKEKIDDLEKANATLKKENEYLKEQLNSK